MYLNISFGPLKPNSLDIFPLPEKVEQSKIFLIQCHQFIRRITYYYRFVLNCSLILSLLTKFLQKKNKNTSLLQDAQETFNTAKIMCKNLIELS